MHVVCRKCLKKNQNIYRVLNEAEFVSCKNNYLDYKQCQYIILR